MAIPQISNITKAVESQLRANLDAKYTITRNEAFEYDPNRTAPDAWIGIYRAPIEYEAHTTGATPWLGKIGILILVTVTHVYTGAALEEALEFAVKEVLDACETDRTFDGNVSIITGYEINYDLPDFEKAEHYMQTARITVNTEVRA